MQGHSTILSILLLIPLTPSLSNESYHCPTPKELLVHPLGRQPDKVLLHPPGPSATGIFTLFGTY